jgi:hypothetical protein
MGFLFAMSGQYGYEEKKMKIEDARKKSQD